MKNIFPWSAYMLQYPSTSQRVTLEDYFGIRLALCLSVSLTCDCARSNVAHLRLHFFNLQKTFKVWDGKISWKYLCFSSFSRLCGSIICFLMKDLLIRAAAVTATVIACLCETVLGTRKGSFFSDSKFVVWWFVKAHVDLHNVNIFATQKVVYNEKPNLELTLL